MSPKIQDMDNKTIVALSTPPGEGGIGIIRLSGSAALKIAKQYFAFKTKQGGLKKADDKFKFKPRKLYYGYFLDEQGEEIDEVLLSYMAAPNSYTCEDVVEINVHGGIISVRKILELMLQGGARLAEPGEFTRRAYINGRIDLVQAESTLALIRAKTDKGMKAALQGVKGNLSKTISKLRNQLLEVAAEIEVNVDFPHDDIEREVKHRKDMENQIQEVYDQVQKLIEKHKAGKVLHEGLKTVIAGKPNVGKSSLYNILIGEDRALVTDIPGTTRDLLMDYINIKGVPLRIIDTAGIRSDGSIADKVEQLGVNYSRQALEEADLIIFVVDAETGITPEDRVVYQYMVNNSEAARIIFVNKMDLNNTIQEEEIIEALQDDVIVYASLLHEQGLEELEQAILNTTYAGSIKGEEGTLVLEARQGELLQKAAASLKEALVSIQDEMPMDLITIDLNHSHGCLGEIIGDNMKADLLDVIFSRFCIGK